MYVNMVLPTWFGVSTVANSTITHKFHTKSTNDDDT